MEGQSKDAMDRAKVRNHLHYLRNSIRFRTLSCLLISVTLGLGLASLSRVTLTELNLMPLREEARHGVIILLAVVYTVLLLALQFRIMLYPIMRLNQLLRQMKLRSEIRQLDPAEFAELGPLIQAALDFLEWAEKQQQVSAVIHQAFRKRAEDLADYDALTGLYNKHYLHIILPLQIAHMANLKDQLSAIMVDVDHFKHYNDTNGHPEGDGVLAKVSEILRNSVRDQDICCRYGGEEFFITLPNAQTDRAVAIAERIRQAIEQTEFPHGEQQPSSRLTVSLGVATYPTHADVAEELIQCADQALYVAKRAGRNRTCVYEDIMDANGIIRDVLTPIPGDVPRANNLPATGSKTGQTPRG